jgi:hypothetical protein
MNYITLYINDKHITNIINRTATKTTLFSGIKICITVSAGLNTELSRGYTDMNDSFSKNTQNNANMH